MKITHDFHIHTNLSVCAKEEATLKGYLAHAKTLGLKQLGISNHFWDSTIAGANEFYQPQDYQHLTKIQPELDAYDGEIALYFGCEAEYDPIHHGVAMKEEVAEKFDFILVPNSHTHMMMPAELYEPKQKHAEFMIQAYEDILNCNISRYITAMAHPFEAVCCPYDNSLLIDMISDDTYRWLFDKTAEKGIAVEINVASMKEKTPEEVAASSPIRLFRLAKECGCKFLFGSDAHDLTAHDSYGNATLVAELLGLQSDDLAPIVRK